jgi:hypothetical protein
MSSPNINVIFQAIAVVTNQQVSNAPQVATFDFANPTLPIGSTGGTAFVYNPQVQALTSPGTTVTLPATVYAIFVQNLSTSTGIVQVVVTPNGQFATSPMPIGPNGVFVLFDPGETAGGFTALKLTAITGTVPCAVLVAY